MTSEQLTDAQVAFIQKFMTPKYEHYTWASIEESMTTAAGREAVMDRAVEKYRHIVISMEREEHGCAIVSDLIPGHASFKYGSSRFIALVNALMEAGKK